MDDTYKIILRPYKYLYYRVYVWQLKLYGPISAPEIPALCAVSLLFLSNLLAINTFCEFVLGFDFFQIYWDFVEKHNITNFQQWVIIFIVSLIIDIIIGRSNLIQKLIREYKHETASEKRNRAILLWIFFIASVVVFFIGTHFHHIAARSSTIS